MFTVAYPFFVRISFSGGVSGVAQSGKALWPKRCLWGKYFPTFTSALLTGCTLEARDCAPDKKSSLAFKKLRDLKHTNI